MFLLTQEKGAIIGKSSYSHAIVQALGQARTAALPVFHALSGADDTECVLGHAKTLCWKAFLNVDEDIGREMEKLGLTLTPSDRTIKKFVCELCSKYIS